jgi:hypothetical protein
MRNRPRRQLTGPYSISAPGAPRNIPAPSQSRVDESRAIGARIEVRNHAARGWQAAPRCVGHANSRAKRPERALHGVDQPIGEVCGGDRAARRMARNADDATLPQANVDPAIAASGGRHARPDTIEDAAERPRCRGSLRQIEPAGHVVGIVPQVDGDARRRCQSNGGSSTCSATAISRAAIYATRARHSAKAAERLCL